MSVIHAGSETTAHTLANLIWELLQNPLVHQRLTSSIRSADYSSPPTLADVRKNAYLEACIKETNRLHAISSNPIERTVPNPGVEIDGLWIPGGTVVASNTRALALDPTIYGQDSHAFNPDRWLTATQPQLVLMERANFGFSHGKRNCIGMHMAMAELLKTTSALLNEFDIKLATPGAQRTQQSRFMNYVNDLPVIMTPRKE